MRTISTILAGLAFLALISSTATPSLAAETPKPSEEKAVTLSPVALPIVLDGRLANYIFVTVKVILTRSADVTLTRAKEPYFRDALVRAGHRSPFVLRTDYNHIDVAKLRSVMMREASAVTGPNVVRDIVVLEQTPQHFIPQPRPAPVNPH